MKRWGYLALFIGLLIGLQGCTIFFPTIKKKINPVELPQYGLDFRVVLEKEVYQLGEPVIVRMKIKNMWAKNRTLRILSDEKQKVSFEYRLSKLPHSYPFVHYSSGKAITLTIPPLKEVEVDEMRWVWDQTDNWLKEPAGIGYYFFEPPLLTNVEVDGQAVGPVWVIVEEGELDGFVRWLGFKIVHPVFERLENMGLSFLLVKTNVEKELINMQVRLYNLSEQQHTISIKPAGTNPIVRLRVLGPVDGPPILRAVHEVKETVSVTIPSKNIVVVTEFSWDFRDQTTGALVPEGLYMAVVELCGLVEVNGETIGTIENPVKIGAPLSFWKEG